MPRVLPIASITNQPICKNAGAGGFSGSPIQLCLKRARIGKMGQCFRCKLNRPTRQFPLFWWTTGVMLGKCGPNQQYGTCGGINTPVPPTS